MFIIWFFFWKNNVGFNIADKVKKISLTQFVVNEMNLPFVVVLCVAKCKHTLAIASILLVFRVSLPGNIMITFLQTEWNSTRLNEQRFEVESL